MKHAINVKLRLPDEYQAPQTGAGHYAISIKKTTGLPGAYPEISSNVFPNGSPLIFSFHIVPGHDPAVAGDEFSVKMQINHEGTDLLVDNEHTFIWNGGSQEVEIDLSLASLSDAETAKETASID
ncbi:hypothetical protein [Pseudomonas halotolerans]|uniref:hypothetical protein n=1 Tax=Pseudomonas halotolerans TaxID=3143552 RepID=UPI0031D6B0B6